MKNAEFAKYIKNVALPECKKGNTDYFDVAQWIFTLRFEKQLQIDVAIKFNMVLRGYMSLMFVGTLYPWKVIS